MQMRTNQNKVDKALKNCMKFKSKIDDSSNIYKKESLEEAFKKRYGKSVKISVSYDLTEYSTLKEYTLNYKTSKGGNYFVTEYLVDDVTKSVILSFVHNGQLIQNMFKRFVDAEVTLSDLISEE